MKLINTRRAAEPREHVFPGGGTANIFDVIFIVELEERDGEEIVTILNNLPVNCTQVRMVHGEDGRFTITADPVTREGLRTQLQTHCPALAKLIKFYDF